MAYILHVAVTIIFAVLLFREIKLMDDEIKEKTDELKVAEKRLKQLHGEQGKCQDS